MSPATSAHDLVALGEVMLRLAPPPPQRLEQATSLDVQIGGTEANVAAACARLGLRTALISALPAEHAWGDRTVREMTGHGVDCSGVVRRPGSRMGLYFLEYGAAPRPVRVLYDRRDSAASRLVPDDVDWGLVRGARMIHLTGVTAALGPNLRDVLRRALDEATGAGVPVSFDVNYRSRLWSPKEARQFLDEILPRLRHLFIGADDAATLFDLVGSPEESLAALGALAPQATVALTLGEAGSAVRAGAVHGAAVEALRRHRRRPRGRGGRVCRGVPVGDALRAHVPGSRRCRHRARRAQVHDLGGCARGDAG